jgi:hypothetical protein
MASADVTVINGIGPGTKQTLLVELQVTTVGQLAAFDISGDKKCTVPNFSTLIERAKRYVSSNDTVTPGSYVPEVSAFEAAQASPATQIILSGQSIQNECPTPELLEACISSLPTPVLDAPENKYLSCKHSWYEKLIVIPRFKGGDLILVLAVIYELCLEPTNRVSLMCSWEGTGENSEKMCKRTYSPQYLAHFNVNADLPEFKVAVTPEEWGGMSQKFSLQAALLETNRIMMLPLV